MKVEYIKRITLSYDDDVDVSLMESYFNNKKLKHNATRLEYNFETHKFDKKEEVFEYEVKEAWL